MWALRPVRDEVKAAAVKNAVYLLELRRVLLDNLLDDFRSGVDIYLRTARDAGENKKQEPHVLPEEFRRWTFGSGRRAAEERRRSSDRPTIRDNVVRSVDPVIRTSAHGIRTIHEDMPGGCLVTVHDIYMRVRVYRTYRLCCFFRAYICTKWQQPARSCSIGT